MRVEAGLSTLSLAAQRSGRRLLLCIWLLLPLGLGLGNAPADAQNTIILVGSGSRNFMHENRETSETPAVQPDRRSAGEGSGQTARADVAEESHSGVVPMNHSNKDTKTSAESEKGRPLIKENACQLHTHPTQSGKGVSQGLAGVREAARANKETRFTALLHHLSVDLLRKSFYPLKRKAAPGVDGVTWQEYETGLEDRLIDLPGRVHRGGYRALPSRRVYIEKADGRRRAQAAGSPG